MSDKRKLELTRKIGLFGLGDLRKIAPIGDLGYMNGWYPPFGSGAWMSGGLERSIYKAFCEQKEKFGWKVDGGDTKWRCTDHWFHCPELSLSWQVDSGD